MKWEKKGLRSTFFVSSLGSCLWQKSLGPFLADPVLFPLGAAFRAVS